MSIFPLNCSPLIHGGVMAEQKALLIVDLQKDFCAGGSLAVPDAEAVIPIANQLQPYFDIVVATKDWHPKDHMSFASNHAGRKVGEEIKVNNYSQVLWPDHCVQESTGAEFHPQFDTQHIDKIIYKGIDKNIDSYSAFYDNEHLRSTGLFEYLREQQVRDVYIVGLATDYCVKYSTLDATGLGFNVYVIADGCRGVELQSGDIAKAFEEMQTAGAKIISVKELVSPQGHP